LEKFHVQIHPSQLLTVWACEIKVCSNFNLKYLFS